MVTIAIEINSMNFKLLNYAQRYTHAARLKYEPKWSNKMTKLNQTFLIEKSQIKIFKLRTDTDKGSKTV